MCVQELETRQVPEQTTIRATDTAVIRQRRDQAAPGVVEVARVLERELRDQRFIRGPRRVARPGPSQFIPLAHDPSRWVLVLHARTLATRYWSEGMREHLAGAKSRARHVPE
jgi:hypothetical protein